MSNKLGLILSALLTASMLLAACLSSQHSGEGLPSQSVTPTVALVQPTIVPAATAGPLPNGASLKVGLVTDIGGVADQAFNQLAWAGIQKASKDMGFQTKFIESKQPADYEQNIDVLATEGYNVIITVGSLLGDATALKAKQYPNLKFAIIDHAYTDGGLTNVTSLMFAEDQIGFLAGVLAGGMSKSGFVCSVSSLRTPASERYMPSFFS